MLSRVAENLYWIGRYVERAENVARLLDDAFHYGLDAVLDEAGVGPVEAVLTTLACRPAFERQGGGGRDAILRFLTFDRHNDQSITSMAARARENARGCQETLSAEAWEQINQLYLYLTGQRAQRKFRASPYQFYRSLKRSCILFGGLLDTTLPRREAYHFLQAGRYLERSDAVSRMVVIKMALVQGGAGESAPLEAVHLASLLRVCSAHEAYLKTYRERIDPPLVLQYLVLDADFPRAVRFCVDRCLESAHELAGGQEDGYGSEAERVLGRLQGELRYMDLTEIMARGVEPVMDGVQQACARVHSALCQAYFLT